jgi:hypothetical protein
MRLSAALRAAFYGRITYTAQNSTLAGLLKNTC